MLVYSQQVMAGIDHFVLLAIPFFVLAGLLMEANGMSSRLIELLLRIFGRMRGGLNLITITATAFFSGVSGSKLADIAAVGGIVMPAVRRTKQDPNDAAGLLASDGGDGRDDPALRQHDHHGLRRQHLDRRPVHRRSRAGGVLALSLAARRDLLRQAHQSRRGVRDAHADAARCSAARWSALVMIVMIGKGVTSGVATSTEVSAFAVVYALVVGGLAFRELTLKSIVRLFVRSAR